MNATVTPRSVEILGARDASGMPLGPWRAGWLRFRRDRWGMVALVAVLVVLFLGFFGAAIVSRLVGHSGAEQFPFAANTLLRPVGPLTRVPAPHQVRYDDYGGLLRPRAGGRTALLIFGADGPLGRDELIRLLDGLRVSLSIAIGAALIALLIALPVGCVSGYFGGVTDAVVSQFTEIIMAFPLLLFLVFANTHLQGLRAVGWGWVFPAGVLDEALLIGVFTAFYPTRLIRAQMLVLRNAEFVESARMVGASHERILRRHLASAPCADAARLVCDRGRDEHPDRGRVELHRRLRRPGLHRNAWLAADDGVGDGLQPADLQQPRLHSLANDPPDAADHHRGCLAEPPCRGHPASDGTEGATVRAATGSGGSCEPSSRCSRWSGGPRALLRDRAASANGRAAAGRTPAQQVQGHHRHLLDLSKKIGLCRRLPSSQLAAAGFRSPQTRQRHEHSGCGCRLPERLPLLRSSGCHALDAARRRFLCPDARTPPRRTRRQKHRLLDRPRHLLRRVDPALSCIR